MIPNFGNVSKWALFVISKIYQMLPGIWCCLKSVSSIHYEDQKKKEHIIDVLLQFHRFITSSLTFFASLSNVFTIFERFSSLSIHSNISKYSKYLLLEIKVYQENYMQQSICILNTFPFNFIKNVPNSFLENIVLKETCCVISDPVTIS